MPPAAQDQSTPATAVRQVAGSEDGATMLGASADTVPQVEGGAPGAGSAPPGPNPDEELEAPEPPFEATCPTCEKPLAVYVPDPEPAPSNAYKVDTGFCVGCGRRWTKAELELAGTLAEDSSADGEGASGAADGEGAADPAGKKDKDAKESKDAKDTKDTKDAKDGSASGAGVGAGTPAEGASSVAQAPKSSTASSSSSSSAKSP